jgi:hypothetical protein
MERKKSTEKGAKANKYSPVIQALQLTSLFMAGATGQQK